MPLYIQVSEWHVLSQIAGHKCASKKECRGIETVALRRKITGTNEKVSQEAWNTHLDWQKKQCLAAELNQGAHNTHLDWEQKLMDRQTMPLSYGPTDDASAKQVQLQMESLGPPPSTGPSIEQPPIEVS